MTAPAPSRTAQVSPPGPIAEELIAAVARWNDALHVMARWATHHDAALRRDCAAHPDTSGDLLDVLSRDEDDAVAAAVAANPNAWATTLDDLAAERSDGDCGVARGLASNPASPPALLDRLIGRHDTDSDIVNLVLLNPAVAAGTAALFIDVAGRVTLTSLALAAHTSESLLPRLAASPLWEVREAVADRDDVSPDLLGLLAEDPDRHVRGAVAANERSPALALDRLAGDDHVPVVELVAANPATRPETLRTLTGTHASRLALLGNPACPEDLLRDLFKAPDDFRLVIDGAVVSNQRCPHDVLATVAERALAVSSPDRWSMARQTLRAVAVHPSCPRGVLAALLDAVPAVSGVADNPAASAEMLTVLAAMPHDWVDRCGVARNAATPQAVRRKLAHDPSALVRRGVAASSHTPTALLDEMLVHSDPLMRELIAENPAASVDALHALALSRDSKHRQRVAANRSAGSYTLTRLCADPSALVRRAAIDNPSTPDGVRASAAGDPNSLVAAAVQRTGSLLAL